MSIPNRRTPKEKFQRQRELFIPLYLEIDNSRRLFFIIFVKEQNYTIGDSVVKRARFLNRRL